MYVKIKESHISKNLKENYMIFVMGDYVLWVKLHVLRGVGINREYVTWKVMAKKKNNNNVANKKAG